MQARNSFSSATPRSWLPIGARLPTVRQLSADLGLAPGTIVRAFRELETEGVIETRGRHGTRVRSIPAAPARAERERRIRDAAATYAAIAAELVMTPDDALAHVRSALEVSVPPS
jgi:DNA-binding transcriptional regulator YhcF (GntR family)